MVTSGPHSHSGLPIVTKTYPPTQHHLQNFYSQTGSGWKNKINYSVSKKNEKTITIYIRALHTNINVRKCMGFASYIVFSYL